MNAVHTIAEIGIGLLFGVGAVFNTIYTLRHGDEFYGSFATAACLPGPVRSSSASSFPMPGRSPSC